MVNNNSIKQIILPREPITIPCTNIPTLPDVPQSSYPRPNTETPITLRSLSPAKITSSKEVNLMPSQKRKRALEMLPDELGKLIQEDVDIFLKQGWKGLVNHCRPRSDFAALDITHPARRILKQYKHTGVPVVTKDRP